MLYVGLGAWAQLDGCASVREREKREVKREERGERENWSHIITWLSHQCFTVILIFF